MSVVKYSGIQLEIPKVTMEKVKKYRLDKLYYVGKDRKCKVDTKGLDLTANQKKNIVDEFYKKLWGYNLLKPVEIKDEDVESLGAQIVRIYKKGSRIVNSINGKEILLNDIEKVILENVKGRRYNDRNNITIKGIKYKIANEILEDVYKPIQYSIKTIVTGDSGKLELKEEIKKAYIVHLPVESKIERKIFLPNMIRVYNDGNTDLLNDPWIINAVKATSSKYIYDKDMIEKDPKFFSEITSIDVSEYRMVNVLRGGSASEVNIPPNVFDIKFEWVKVNVFEFKVKYKYSDVGKIFEINHDNFKDNYVFNSIIWGRIKNWLSNSWSLGSDTTFQERNPLAYIENDNSLIEYKAYLMGIRPNHIDYKKTIDLKKSYDYVVKTVRDWATKFKNGEYNLPNNVNYTNYNFTLEYIDKILDERNIDPLQVILDKARENKKDINKER